ncbi:MAG: hypothetical protein EA426_01695 [Spirochaetaceae bacterium]|nr:MAG: hypothetical protein EA426_01695 [Spirochaetaceae bacterium]
MNSFELFQYNPNHRPVASGRLEHSTLSIYDETGQQFYLYSADNDVNEIVNELSVIQAAVEPDGFAAIEVHPLSATRYLIWYLVFDGPGSHRVSLLDLSDDTLSAPYEANGIIQDVTEGPDEQFYILVDRGDFFPEYEVDVVRVDLSIPELVVEMTVELSSENPEQPPLGAPHRFGVDAAGNFHVLDAPPANGSTQLSVKTFDSSGRFLRNWATVTWAGQGQFFHISKNYQNIAVFNDEVYVVDRRGGGDIQVFGPVGQIPSPENSSLERASDEPLLTPGLNDEWFLTVAVRDAANNPITGLMRDAFEVRTLSGNGESSIAFVYDDRAQPGVYRLAVVHDTEETFGLSVEVMGVEVGSFSGLTVGPVNTADGRRFIIDTFGFSSRTMVITTVGDAEVGNIELLRPEPTTFEDYTLEPGAGPGLYELTVTTTAEGFYDESDDDNIPRQTLRVQFENAEEGDREHIDIWFVRRL